MYMKKIEIKKAVPIIVLLLTLFVLGCDIDYRARYPLPARMAVGTLMRIELGCFYLPALFSPENQYPLIVLLHGLNQTEESFLYSNSFRDQADKRGYILCAVRSEQHFWNEEITSPDIENIRHMIMAMRAHFPIREDKICIFGFSAGSHFTHTMILFNRIPLSNKKLFTAFIAGSGGSGFLMDQYREKDYIPDDLKIPGFIFWGQREVPHPGEEMAEFLLKHDWDITVKAHSGHHSLGDDLIEQAFDWLDKKIP
jgi:predicted esterase